MYPTPHAATRSAARFTPILFVLLLVTACQRTPTTPSGSASPAGTCRPTAIVEAPIRFPTPPPSAAVPFLSAPDPANNGVQYAGTIVMGVAQVFIGPTTYYVTIVNTGPAPLPVGLADFSFVSKRNPATMYPFTATGGLSSAGTASGAIVAPGQRFESQFTIRDVPGGFSEDIKATYTIRGGLGSVEIPIYTPAPLPRPPTLPPPTC